MYYWKKLQSAKVPLNGTIERGIIKEEDCKHKETYLSTKNPAAKQPKIAPIGTSDPIQDSSSFEIGRCKGLSGFMGLSSVNLGRIGLVHPIIAPVATIHRLPEKQLIKHLLQKFLNKF